ncbi:MAG: radical SAM protein [Vicinamibacterales bacterium]
MSQCDQSAVETPLLFSPQKRRPASIPRESVRVLLVGPYDPTCGEYTFLSPPLGIWRLAGWLQHHGFPVTVLDPNCCEGQPENRLEDLLRESPFAVIGFSTTGMTLRFDLGLAHLARSIAPNALLVAGGMEATFNPGQVLDLGRFDCVILGEGERPLVELVERLWAGAPLAGIAGTVFPTPNGLARIPQAALTREELRDSIFHTPYEQMPYRKYWSKLENAYRVGDLSTKGEREARLAEVRSVRLITLNYCPMGCTFCSSTNFLNAAQDGTARIARLDPDECMTMIARLVALYPEVRTVIFQDDIFVFTSDKRIAPLCEAILAAKREGRLRADLQFISTNRIDAMTPERLGMMRKAGFRVLGFGVENFSLSVLKEFNKAQIYPFIEKGLSDALGEGITPFLDMILTSPGCQLEDLATTVREAYKWTLAGCETGMYPYVIPFSGAVMAKDPRLVADTVQMTHTIPGTDITWKQPAKILPKDDRTRRAILEIEERFQCEIARLEADFAHLPSRVRSLVWVLCASPVLSAEGFPMPSPAEVRQQLTKRLPVPRPRTARMAS